MNVISVDIGNSAVKTALIVDGVVALKHRQSIALRRDNKVDWDSLLDFTSVCENVDGIGIASVVPSITGSVQEHAARHSIPTVQVSSSARLPFVIEYSTPDTLGADRLAAAAGGWSRMTSQDGGKHLIVVDAGTAVNIEVVRADGVYLGGPISPGLGAMRDALIARTSQLPSIELALPEKVIGDSTENAVRSGIVFAYVSGVSGIVDRIIDALSEESPVPDRSHFVILTGGDSDILLQAGFRPNRIETDLVLLGTADVAERELSSTRKI